MNFDDTYYIIGIDGGATNSRGVLFSNNGITLAAILDRGTNIALDGEAASKRIALMIEKLCEDAEINIEDVDAVGLGLAGASDEDGRDMIFKALDALKLSRRSIIMNDAEASYEVSCPGGLGILVTVGTGVICIGRNESSKICRVAGDGHAHGDIGSGFWIGKKAIMEIERVSRKHKFLTVDAYSNDKEKEMMYSWNLTAKTILHTEEWKKLFLESKYTGDFYWFKP